jgi:hypothetical protein
MPNHKAYRKSRRNHQLLLAQKTEQIRRLWKKHVKGYRAEIAKPIQKFDPRVAALHAVHANVLRKQAQKQFGVTFGFEFKVRK